MRTRKLGFSDLELTTVGLGTWAIGGPWQFGWGPQDDNDSIATILNALDAGINWIDTAPIYGLGHSEEIVGKALKQTSHKPLIATKCSLLWNQKGEKVSCLKKESIRNECHNSLKRLGVDVLDLYQIHWPQPEEDLEQAVEEIAKLAEQGKVRYFGVSNFNVEQIKRAQAILPVASVQPSYSMIHREIENELLGYCGDSNIGVVAYSPMQRGLLTGKFSKERLAALADDDHRKGHSDFQEPKFSATLELVEQLKEIANQNGITLAQLAIAWVLRTDVVTAAIVGARKFEQIIETAAASDVDLSEENIEKIEELLCEREEKIKKKTKK